MSTTPIKYTKKNGGVAFGYRAELLPAVCEVFLKARRAGVLSHTQEHIAIRSEIVLGGLATVGIFALIDEATGYDEIRQKALAEILQQYISDRLLEWAKTFPDEFYRELFKLRGWDYNRLVTKRPPLTGKLTIDIVYRRLPEGVLAELEKKNPMTPKGYRKHKLFQWLSEDFGNPTLRAHLYALIGMMRGSSTWRQFYNQLERSYPKTGETPKLPFADDPQTAGKAKFEPLSPEDITLAMPGVKPKDALRAFMEVKPKK